MNELQILSMRDELEKIASLGDKVFNFLHKNPVGKVVKKGLTPIVDYGTRLSGSIPRTYRRAIKAEKSRLVKNFDEGTKWRKEFAEEDIQKEIKLLDRLKASAKSPELKKLREESKQSYIDFRRGLHAEDTERRRKILMKELSGPPGSFLEKWKKGLAESTAETAQTRKRTALASVPIVGGGFLYNKRRKK